MLNIRFLYLLFACLIASSAAHGDEDHDDDDDDCYEECEETKQCRVLDKLKPTKKVERCVKFLESSCDDSEDVVACLTGFRGTKAKPCSKRISTKAVPCLKCHARCEEDDEDDDDDDDEMCSARCSASKSCAAVRNADDNMIKNCDVLMEKECDKEDDKGECLERLKDMPNINCTQSFRKEAHTCYECFRSCEDMDDEGSGHDDHEVFCQFQCLTNPGCKFVDAASDSVKASCEDFKNKHCDDDDEVSDCFEKLEGVEDESCPMEYRRNMKACVSCEDQCDDEMHDDDNDHDDHDEGEDHEENDDDDDEGDDHEDHDDDDDDFDDECQEECMDDPGCKYIDETSDSEKESCEDLKDKICDDTEDMSECFDMLRKVNHSSCSVQYRKSMEACVMCEDQCEKKRYEEKACKAECSKRPECVAMDEISDDIMEACDEFVDENCKSYSRVSTCLEEASDEGNQCRSEFKQSAIKCMKCDEECMNEPIPPSITPTGMTEA